MHLLFLLLQRSYILATSCTLEEHSKRPDRNSCLSLAQAFVKKASAAIEAAAKVPTPPKEVQSARKALHTLVCPCLPTHVTTSEAQSGRIKAKQEIIRMPLVPAMSAIMNEFLSTDISMQASHAVADEVVQGGGGARGARHAYRFGGVLVIQSTVNRSANLGHVHRRRWT